MVGANIRFEDVQGKIKFEDGTEGHMAAPEGISIGQPVSFGENVGTAIF